MHALYSCMILMADQHTSVPTEKDNERQKMKNIEIKKKGNRWIDKNESRWLLIFSLALLLLFGIGQIAFGDVMMMKTPLFK